MATRKVRERLSNRVRSGVAIADSEFKALSDIDVRNEAGLSMLQIAMQAPVREVTAVQLIECGADVDRPDSTGRTPLHYACAHGSVSLVRACLLRTKDDLTIPFVRLPAPPCQWRYSPKPGMS
jgi:ankyrin repeat protein